MKHRQTSKRRGSALLITLGVLSMAMVMGMCFAFTARTSKQVSKINADQVKARLMAESGLARTIALMRDFLWDQGTDTDKVYISANEAAGPFNFTTRQITVGTDNYRTLRYAMSVYVDDETTLRNELKKSEVYFPWLGAFSSFATDSSKGYGFQPMNDADGKIIGRIGYIIVDDTDKLDVNQMLTHSNVGFNSPFVLDGENKFAPIYDVDGDLNEYLEGDDFPYNITSSATGHINNSADGDPIDTIRLGLSLREVWFTNRKNYFDHLEWRDADNEAKVPYMSYAYLRNVNGTDFLNNDYLKYTFFSGEDIEAYWDATNGVECQRFDLSGREWGGWDVAAAKKNELVDQLSGNTGERPAFFVSGNVAGAAQPDETGFGIKGITKQIAANMVDFCDNDNEATYKISETSTATSLMEVTQDSDVEYFGNEAVPYVNEVGLRFLVTQVDSPENASEPEPTLHTYTYKLNFLPYLELLNIYPDCGTGNYPAGKGKVYVEGTLQRVGGANAGPVNWPGGDAGKYEFEFEYGSDSGVRFVEPTMPAEASIDVGTKELKSVTSVKYVIQISRINVVTYDTSSDTKVYDFAFWNNTTPHGAFEMEANSAMALTGYWQGISFQASDPRLNHKSTSWNSYVSTEADASDELDGFTFAAKNTNLTFADANAEDALATLTFADADHTFSTAFIPNRPFKNIWELGCIHKGSAFETLDLLGVDKGLVDIVKIGPVQLRRDTFNPNAVNIGAYYELLKNIDITRGFWKDYQSTDSGYNGPDTDENTAAFITAESNFASTFKLMGTASYNRSDTADAFKALLPENCDNAGDANFLPKRQREALFGRTVGMFSTRFCRYTVLVTADALEEIEVDATQWGIIKDTVPNPLEYAGRYFSKLGTQRVLANVIHDTWHGTFTVVQVDYLPE